MPAVNLMFSDYDTMKESFTNLGQILGGEYQEKLTKWCEYQEEWETTIRERLADVPEDEKPVLYFCGAVYLGSLASAPNASELTEEEILALYPDRFTDIDMEQLVFGWSLSPAACWCASATG